MSADTKTKKMGSKAKSKSTMKHGASPIPTGPGSMSACGHSKCGLNCNVHYVGATTQLRDHHAFHAARGVANIWAAAIVTGLSVVLTGAIAYSAVQAKSDTEATPAMARNADTMRIMQRLELMEKALQDVKVLCAARPAESASSTSMGDKKVKLEEKRKAAVPAKTP